MSEVSEVAQQTQSPVPVTPAVPASPSDETSAKPENKADLEGTAKEQEQETPQKRESRRQRQLNRERNARIAAETELRLLKEAQQVRQQPHKDAADDVPRREQFESYEEFIRADARYHAEKAADERARKVLDESKKKDSESSQRETQEKAAREWNAKLEKARDAVDDFDEVCSESEAVVTQPMAAAIQESDQGALIAYYLAKNPAEAERISKLSPSKQAAAIVGLEEKVAKPARQASKAPDPIAPVGRASPATDSSPSDKDDVETWRRKREAELAARRKR